MKDFAQQKKDIKSKNPEILLNLYCSPLLRYKVGSFSDVGNQTFPVSAKT